MTVNWQINLPDIIAILGAGLVLYGRLISLETKIQPIWDWWNSQTHRDQGRDQGART
jgi:hypothetical protein